MKEISFGIFAFWIILPLSFCAMQLESDLISEDDNEYHNPFNTCDTKFITKFTEGLHGSSNDADQFKTCHNDRYSVFDQFGETLYDVCKGMVEIDLDTGKLYLLAMTDYFKKELYNPCIKNSDSDMSKYIKKISAWSQQKWNTRFYVLNSDWSDLKSICKDFEEEFNDLDSRETINLSECEKLGEYAGSSFYLMGNTSSITVKFTLSLLIIILIAIF
jgi:hypothetical protein